MQNRIITISILVLIALIVIGYSFFQYFQTREEEVPDEEEEITEIVYPGVTPVMVVQGFYDWYIADDNALPNTGYKTAESLTQDFVDLIDSKVSTTSEETQHDPFVCAESLPTELIARATDIIQDHTTVVVDETVGEEEISFTVELILRDNDWKIENVICFIKG